MKLKKTKKYPNFKKVRNNLKKIKSKILNKKRSKQYLRTTKAKYLIVGVDVTNLWIMNYKLFCNQN